MKSALSEYKNLRLDNSDVEALKSEVDGLESSTKQDKKYADAWKTLTEQHQPKIDALLDTAREMKDFKSKDLPKMINKINADFRGIGQHARTLLSHISSVGDLEATGTDNRPIYDKSKIDAFLKQVDAIIPNNSISELAQAGNTLADSSSGDAEQKAARENALGTIRLCMDIAYRDRGVNHLKRETFSSYEGPDYAGIRERLNKLELKLLTCLGD